MTTSSRPASAACGCTAWTQSSTSTSTAHRASGCRSSRPRGCGSGWPAWATTTSVAAQIAARYRSIDGLTWQTDHTRHVHHLAVLRAADRERARAGLASDGVASAVHYPRSLTEQPAYRDFGCRPCPESEAWAATCVSVPCFPELTDGEVDRVVAALTRLAEDG